MRINRFISCLTVVVLLCFAEAKAQSYEEWIDSANVCIERDSLSLAENCLKRAVETEPGNARNSLLLTHLGHIQHQQGKLGESIQSYSLALNYTPLDIPALLGRAASYMELGDEERAYVDYSNVLDKDIDNKEALLLRAYIAVRKRAYDVARTDYTRLLDSDADNADAALGLALLNQKQNRLKEATEQLSELIRKHPENATYLQARADVLLQRGLFDLSLLDCEEAIRIAPKDAYAYVSRAEVYLQLKRKRDARKDLDQAVQLGMERVLLADMYKQCR